MKNKNIRISVLTGLIAGHLFAESEQLRPFKVVNTIRFGYSDNLYRTPDGESSGFVEDTVDLSFRAAFSDRTDLMVKSRLNVLDDDDGNEIYPNLYAILNHSISPRLLLSFSEYYRSGDKSGTGSVPSNGKRYNYFFNSAVVAADYVLTGKDRVSVSANHTIQRHDSRIDNLDHTTVGVQTAWQRELISQRTRSTLNLEQRRTVNDNMDNPGDMESFDATDLSAGISHTFNQKIQGTMEIGGSYIQRNFNTIDSGDATIEPLIRSGLIYSFSPKTRLTADFSTSYAPSQDNGYGGQSAMELIFGAQHELTAKLTARATARFSRGTYDKEDSQNKTRAGMEEDRMDFELALSYRISRIHFIETRIQHSEKEYSNGDEGWEENRADIGWRVELN